MTSVMLRVDPPVARLLVLVPAGDLPVVELAQRIWALAAAAGAAVLLVGLADSPAHEPQTRRQLAVLQSHTQYAAVPVSTRVARTPNWVTAVRQLRRPGDQLVVFAEQEAPAGRWGWGRQPLAQALEMQLHLPAYVITDVALPAVRQPGRWAAGRAWLVSLAVIAVFFAGQGWLQARLPGGAGNALLAVSVIVEFSLLGWVQQQRM